MADDDYNDHLFMLMAAEEARLDADFRFLDDGAQLMLALTSVNDPTDLPDIIVLDLRMPRLDGHGTLKQLQEHPDLWQIPVIVYTSSTRPVDQTTSFDRGARWFETKPSRFPDMVAFARRIGQYVTVSGSAPVKPSRTRHRRGVTFDPTRLRFDPRIFDDIEAALRMDD
ncbi:MAG: response regulator [Acidimicrobiales bacterium]